MLKVEKLWECQSQDEWMQALDNYWKYVKPTNMDLEKELNDLNSDVVKNMNTEEFYNFLLNKYFKWKYTAPNRYASTTKFFKQYKINGMKSLENIKKNLFSFNLNNIEEGLRITSEIKGLGIAGASGLLSLLFPKYFGTVDQFVVKALCGIDDLPQCSIVQKMNPGSLNLKDGFILIKIMRLKASELNSTLKADTWTPRKIDMILWTYGR
jgi:hypothetical protein